MVTIIHMTSVLQHTDDYNMIYCFYNRICFICLNRSHISKTLEQNFSTTFLRNKLIKICIEEMILGQE